MSARIKRIALDKLVPHPGNPNRMSRANFDKLVRNIERTGRYEPLVVRPCPGRRGFFQIINGHHRCEALRQLGHETAEAVVWNVDDEQTDILLTTLNRLQGRDTLDKKLALLQRLSVTIEVRKLAKLLPQTRGQLDRLVNAKPLARGISGKPGVLPYRWSSLWIRCRNTRSRRRSRGRQPVCRTDRLGRSGAPRP
jgi:hypothetical protein